MAYQPIVEHLSQLLMNDWDDRSAMVNPLLPLVFAAHLNDKRNSVDAA